ncbi:MAG: M20/M25/M40 family metallo-hydrolase, partial [Clostridia bacterium]|nr:M20/M25/M40 family metallo-hydrolase [Clostridia bacterium]
ILFVEENQLKASFAVRSSVNTAKQRLLETLSDIAKSFGGQYSSHGHYPAWEYRENSPLRDVMVATYSNLYGNEPIVEAIHAGLECGLFCEKLDGLDAVSFGPDMQDIHTPREKLSVDSCRRTFEYLCQVLKSL